MRCAGPSIRRVAAPPSAIAALAVLALAAPALGQEPVDCANLPTTLELRLLSAAQGASTTLRAPGGYVSGCDEPTDPIDVSVDWGDGTSGPAQIQPAVAPATGFTIVATHVYARAGTFALVIHQHNGRTGVIRDDRHYEAQVQPAGVLVRHQTLVGRAGRRFSGELVTVAVPPAFGARYRARINWGDGSSSAGSVSIAGERAVVRGSHRWRRALRNGTVAVTITEASTGARLVVRRPLRVNKARRG